MEQPGPAVGPMEVTSTSGRASWWSYIWSARRQAAAQQVERAYAADLSNAAAGSDFRDLDALEFMQTGIRDKQGRPVICIVAKHYPAKVIQLEHVFKYFIATCDELVDSAYSLVWFQTEASFFENCPGVFWLWRTYERLPAKYRQNLHRLYVVHCDALLWAGLSAIGPALSDSLWSKVTWVSRIEFLADDIPKAQLSRLPRFIAEHDEMLEEQPLMDYGIVATKEVNALPGGPAPI